jgi:hypothetical protein
MTKEEFQNSIYPFLMKKGYKAVTSANGKPYDGKDIYFCPQDPEKFSITITPGLTRLRKQGKGGYEALCKTQVQSYNDIDQLHEELNQIIHNNDETSLKKYEGCLNLILLLLLISGLLLFSV